MLRYRIISFIGLFRRGLYRPFNVSHSVSEDTVSTKAGGPYLAC